MGLRRVGPASSFCRSVIFAAALVHKTRISRSRESEDYSDSSCGGEDNGARPDHHRNNSSTRSGGALVCRAHRFYHPARVEKSAEVVPGSTLATARPLSVDRIGALGPTRFIQFSRRSETRPLASPAAARAPRAATQPPRRRVASNSRRPMVTVIRPSRARCVNGRIPRHRRAVFTVSGFHRCRLIAQKR